MPDFDFISDTVSISNIIDERDGGKVPAGEKRTLASKSGLK